MSEPARRLDSSVLLPGAKFGLLAIYLAADHAAVAARFASLGLSLELAAYLVLYAALALGLCAAALIAANRVRLAFAAAFAAASLLLQGYEWSTGGPLVYDAFETMVASRGDLGAAAGQHGAVLLSAAAAAFVLAVAVALPPGRMAIRAQLGATIPAALIVALAALFYVRGGEGGRALPAPYAPLAEGAIMASLELVSQDRPRRAAIPPPGARRHAGDVVLVIDESVAANYLDINHRDGVRSGLAEPGPGLQIANFGHAASATNCSVGSNHILRYGGTRSTFRPAIDEMPSVWAYARAAGLRTVYLDGQRDAGELQNGMTAAELAEIDEFRQLDQVSVPERDHELARLLGARLANATAEFILVNKVGAHFPVADKFPAHAAPFQPLPERGRSLGITDVARLPGTARKSDEDWRRYRNAYRNTLVWATGGFFDRLLPHLAGTGAVIVYTSDHGQDLHERGDGSGATHCTMDPRPEEGAVPLVVVAAGDAAIDWPAHAAANHDRASHFRIFPTLLALMGYPAERTARFYGPSLTSRAGDPMTFTPTYYARLGRAPEWTRIDPAALSAPPVSDYLRIAQARPSHGT